MSVEPHYVTRKVRVLSSPHFGWDYFSERTCISEDEL